MEPFVEVRDFVIKVKYGDLLKRFGACARGNTIDHDLNKLRRKIIDLFKFNPRDDLILKYVDEDGDFVSLDNDDELWDAVMSQRLNPLRINVQLKSDIATAPDVKHEVLNYKCEVPPQVEQQPPKNSSTINEAQKSPADPLFNGFNKDPLDFLTRTIPPLLPPELMDTFAKIGFNISQPANNSTGESSGTSGDTTRSKDASIPVSTPSADPFPIQLQRALSQAAVEFAKMAISTIGQIPNNSTGERPGIDDEEATKSTHLPKEEPEPSMFSAGLPTSSTGVPVHFQKRHESVNLSPGGFGLMKTPFPDLNLDACEHPNVSNSEGYPPNDGLLSSDWTGKENVDYDDKSKLVNCRGKSVMPVAPLSMPSQKDEEQIKGRIKAISAPSWGDGISCLMDGGRRKMPTSTTMYPASPGFCFDGGASVNHHSGTAVRDLHIPTTLGVQLHGRNRRKPQGYSDRHTFHQGVRCDGCGMYPIVGSRFKSKVKEDYDLCSICFSQMGIEADYTRIDKTHPLSSHRMLKEYKTFSRRKMYPHLHGVGAKSRVKLESCFVQDVTVVDGTEMPPSTPFTKIWRVRNNGSIPWPYGTQLEWVGGDQFSVRRLVQLEMPVEGCQVGKEIDIAADFVSPPVPGSYISYWRLASPSGQKFGQPVWVLIQVIVPYSSNSVINLNLPPEGINADGLGDEHVNAEPVVGASFAHYVSSSDEILEAFGVQVPVGNTNLEPFDSQVSVGNANLKPSDNQAQSGAMNVESFDNESPHDIPQSDNINVVAEPSFVNENPHDIPHSDNNNVAAKPSFDSENPHDIAHTDSNNAVAKPIPSSTPVSSPLVDIPSAVSYPVIDIPLSLFEPVTADVLPSRTETENVVEQTLLKELEDMGFKHADLNKEILRKNSYNLEQSVEDLCGFTEWDMLLEELQEMGFHDRAKNKKLLEKNGGSIKQVVLDLIAEENK